MKLSNKSFGFTLAEVLITLGIIGVVAAMTMPTLINQTNGAQYKAAYKKALSAISQAVTLNVALEDKSFADVSGTSDADDAAGANTVVGILKARMNVVSTEAPSGYSISGVEINKEIQVDCTAADITNEVAGCTSEDSKKTVNATVNPDLYIFFNDSSMFAFETDTAKDCKKNTPCYGVIDVNGQKGPNKVTTSASAPTDIYPVIFYDQTILPASEAAEQVLYGK